MSIALLPGHAAGLDSQTITFTSTPPSDAIVGGPTYTVTANGGGSGNPVTFTIDASATSVCSISGSVVSFSAIGTCTIDANQAGNGSYADAPQVQQSFAVELSQTINYTSTAPSDAIASGPTYTVTATGGGSGNPVTFTIDTSATSVCSISGSVVSFSAIGTCTIDANQAGNGSYAAAPQVQQSFEVGQGSQTVTFTSPAPSYAAVGGPTYTVTASGGGSGNPVTFTIDTSATSVCSISGSVVSFSATGTCTIDANQLGSSNYSAAPQAQQSFAVSEFSQAITFTSTPPSEAAIGGPTYTVTATGGASGNTVTFTIDASATSVCSISGSVVSFTNAGICTIDANQLGNSNYAAAPQAQQSVPVAQLSQTITFTSNPPSNANPGTHYPVKAVGGASGNPLVYSSSTPTVCKVSRSTVNVIGAGTCSVDANQAGNANYSAAPVAQQSFTVFPNLQTIKFISSPPLLATVGEQYRVKAIGGGSRIPVVFSSETFGVCEVSGSTVSIVGAGTCTIEANQPGNTQYSAAPQVEQSFFIGQRNQTITFTSNPPSNAKVGGPTYRLRAFGGASGNPVNLSVDASAISVCFISGSVVTFTSAGDCIIDANQAGNTSFFAAPQAQQAVNVRQAPVITSTCSSTAAISQLYSCSIVSTGSPTPALQISKLPGWLVFSNGGSGTATVSGTPSKRGTFRFKVTAINSVGKTHQSITVIVN